MLLLSIKAGLRAKEIASLIWAMVTDAEGNIGDTIELTNAASKGRSGRTIPMHPDLRDALVALVAERKPRPQERVVLNSRGFAMTPTTVQVWFHRLLSRVGLGA